MALLTWVGSAQAATKLYVQNAAAPYTPATTRGSWDATASSVAQKLGPTKSGAAATIGIAETSTTTNWDVLLARFITDPLLTDVSFTTSDTVQWIVGSLESSISANDFFHVHVFVTTGDSDTVRGTLLTNSIGATEWPNPTATGRGEGTKTLTAVSAQAGDRIVVEIGYRSISTSGTSFTGTINYGNTGSTDLTSGSTNVTTEPGWVEFSNNFSFATCSSAATGAWSSSGTWNSPCNVSGGPSTSDSAIIASGHTVTLDANKTVAGLNVVGTLSGSSNLTVNGGLTGSGTVSLTSGTTLVDGTSSFGGNKEWSFYGLTFGDGSGTTTTTANDTPPTVWTEQGTDVLPYSTNISGHTVLSYKGKMWFIGGWDQGISDYSRKVYYSTDGITWTEAGTNALPQKLAFHSSVVFQDKMWVIGGNNLTADQRTVYYSTDGATWAQAGTNALPAARKQGAAVVFNGKMWYIGGSNSADVYSSENGITWTTYTSALPTGKSKHSAVVYNGAIYVVGGNYSAKVYSSSNGSTWAEVGTDSFPTTPNGAPMITYNNKMWVLSGYNNTTYLRTVYYSVNGSTWTQAGTNALPAGQEDAAAVVYDGKMWFLGGDDSVKVLNAGNTIVVNGTLGVAANQTLDASYRTFTMRSASGVQVAGTLSGAGDVIISGGAVSGSGTVNLSGGTLTYEPTDWYGLDWTKRQRIVIDNTKVPGSTALTDFPVLVSVTDVDLKSTANGGKVGKDDGTDILFTSSDGVTKLSHELEKYVATTGELVAWVKVPSLSATADTVLLMYYGNAAAADQQSGTAVWGSAYKGVWHFDEGTGSQAGDATSGGSAGTLANTSWATGKVGGALSFNGSSSENDLGSRAALQVSTGVTISCWVNTSTDETTWSRCFAHSVLDADPWDEYTLSLVGASFPVFAADDNIVRFEVETGGSLTYLDSTTPISSSAWHHIVGTWDGTTMTIYIDGAYNNSTGKTGTVTNYNDNTQIGFEKLPNGTTKAGFFGGSIDEVRLLGSARSADWVAAEYANQNDPSTFMTFGDEESVPSISSSSNWTFKNLTIGEDQTAVEVLLGDSGTVTVTGNLVVEPQGTLDMGSKTLILSGSDTPLDVRGALVASTSTVRYTGTSATNVMSVPYYNVELKPASGSPTYTISQYGAGWVEENSLDIAGGLTIGDATNAVTLTATTHDLPLDITGGMTVAASATFVASDSATITLRGDFTNNGTFTHSNGTVVLQPAASTAAVGGSSDTTFYTFTAQQPSKTVSFGAGRNIRFDGTLTLTGVSGNPMWITSTSAGNQWNLYLVGGSPSVTYLNVKDSGCHASSNALPSDGNRYDQGNNGNCWGIVRYSGYATPSDGVSGGGTPLSGGDYDGSVAVVECSGGSGICDDFNRASLGSNWTLHYGTESSVHIINNSDFTGSTTNDNDAVFWNASTFGNDQFSKAVISGLGASNWVGVSVRAANTTAPVGYGCQMSSSSTGDFFVIDANGSYFNLGDPGTASVGDTIEIRAVGTAISCLKNGVVVASATDSRVTTGGAPGMWMYQASDVAQFENWYGGNLAQTGGGQSGGGGASP